MKKETYYCDLCQEERPAADLFGYEKPPLPGLTPYLLIAKNTGPWYEAKRHLCKECISIIKGAKV